MLHRPPHIFINHTWYFITAHTVGKQSIFNTSEQRKIWKDVFSSLVDEYQLEIAAWVLLPNHYHLLGYFKKANLLSTFMKRLHGVTSLKINRIDHQTGRSIWYSYWDHCIRDERDFWTKYNYIHYNPIKHGLVKNLEEWESSSYPKLLRVKGEEWFADCWASYPVIEYNFED